MRNPEPRFKDYHDTGSRRSGRTTRIVDECIQTLFIEGEVYCHDHYPSDAMDEFVFHKVVTRLGYEHNGLVFNIHPKKLHIELAK